MSKAAEAEREALETELPAVGGGAGALSDDAEEGHGAGGEGRIQRARREPMQEPARSGDRRSPADGVSDALAQGATGVKVRASGCGAKRHQAGRA